MNKEKVILLAYPRSGSVYTQYILSYLTKTLPQEVDGKTFLNERFSDFAGSEPRVIKFHYPSYDKYKIPEDAKKMCLLFRHPIENILSYIFSDQHRNQNHHNDDYKKEYVNKLFLKDNEELLNNYYNKYKTNINFFKSFSGEKIVLNYDELTTDPSNQLKEYASFFGYKESGVDSFMKDIDSHKSYGIFLKTRPGDAYTMNTFGKDNFKFRNLLNEDNLNIFEKKILVDKLLF